LTPSHQALADAGDTADAHCSVNGGIGVNLGNTGCLSEAGGQSVYIPNGGAWILNTFGSNSDCSGNPDSSWSFTATGFCHPLNPSDQSYTFTQVSRVVSFAESGPPPITHHQSPIDGTTMMSPAGHLTR
jgi:hypothetical protein